MSACSGRTRLRPVGPIGLLSADGERVAFVSGTTATDCEHVDAWTPAKKSILRVSQPLPAPCSFKNVGLCGLRRLRAGPRRLAGGLVGHRGLREFLRRGVQHRDDAAAAHAGLDNDSGGGGAGGGELLRFNAHGDGDLLVFNSNGVVRIDAQCGPDTGARPPEWSAHVSRGVGLRSPDCGARTQRGRRARRPGLARQRPSVRARRSQGGTARRRQARRRSLGIARGLRRGHRGVRCCNGRCRPDTRSRTSTAESRYSSTQEQSWRCGSTTAVHQADACSGPVLADLEETGLYYSYTTSNAEGRLVFIPRSELERQLEPGASKASAAAGTPAAADANWLLLTSNRDGKRRPDSVDLEGSRLTPLFPPRGRLDPGAVPLAEKTVKKPDMTAAAIYVSRADGSGLRRVGEGRLPGVLPQRGGCLPTRRTRESGSSA